MTMHPSFRSIVVGSLWLAIVLLTGYQINGSIAEAAESALSPTDLAAVVQKYGEQLGTVGNDTSAAALFASQVGPALGLHDVATTLVAKTIPAKVMKELGVQDLAASSQRLVAALAAWHWADQLTKAVADRANPITVPPTPTIDWIQATGSLASFSQVMKEAAQAADPASPDRTAVAISAGRLALEANQRALAEWWQLKSWKDRVRTIRGRNRLCGTWQWVIHNHQQHHQEQKLALIFPPPSPEQSLASGLVETVVLGDNVYLRWEINGQVQEDSLQFTKEGKGLEGTFVNSQGGWGSISGKRTSDCKP
ncbi:MAG: hypothetical protein U0412_12085 [Nitrospira sp.]